MVKQDFLRRLKKEDKLELVTPSKDMHDSYLKKAKNCLISAEILLKCKLYENSVIMSYYAMYNSLSALLLKAGIRCKNHTGSILLLKRLFNRNDLFKIMSSAKKEREENQYQVQDLKLAEVSSKNLFLKAEDFILEIKVMIKHLNAGMIESYKETIDF